jgi:glucokinase
VELVTADIGGTHARFAIATIEHGRVAHLSEPITLHAHEHASFQLAWKAFAHQLGRPLPPAAAIAIAGPTQGEVLRMANNPWIIRPALIPEKLGVTRYTIVNDFAAVAFAVAALDPQYMRHLSGPDRPLPATGAITVLGPGTGLGVALLHRTPGRVTVIETEGGHIDFAPLDALEDRVLAHLRQRYRRVSVERIVSGPGLANLYEAVGAIENQPVQTGDDKALWTRALTGTDHLAAAALDRFCLALGSLAGDLALVQGAFGVAIAGGVGARIADHLPRSGFAARFLAKGRFESRMAAIPVKLVTHPQPGLYGVAAAFAQEHGQ